MAGGSKNNNNNNNNNGKPKKRKFLPHSKPVKKGMYPLRPGVQGFFITCDGGRERQAANEALSLLDTFYDELVDGKDTGPTSRAVPIKPLNKIIKFEDSDSSGDEGEDPEAEIYKEDGENKSANKQCTGTEEESEDKTVDKKCNETEEESEDKTADKKCNETEQESEDKPADKKCDETDNQGKETEEENVNKPASNLFKEVEEGSEEKPAKKQRLEADAKSHTMGSGKVKDKPIDELIEDELKEMGDRNKRRFLSLDSGCNGCIFIQMHKCAGGPGPAKLVQYMMSSAASTKKHMSRFILRVLPAEVTCYASEEEISRAIKPLVEQHFPTEATTPQKFAVLYEARANTGIDRTKIIDAVAKSVPQPHKVDLSNPDKTIVVQIAKTICMMGVAERYKELLKYNLRQLTAPK